MKTVILILALLTSGHVFAQDTAVTKGSGSSLMFTSPDTSQSTLSFSLNRGPIVTIHPDGTIEYGPNYTPDAAAKALWEAVGFERKSRNCQ